MQETARGEKKRYSTHSKTNIRMTIEFNWKKKQETEDNEAVSLKYWKKSM